MRKSILAACDDIAYSKIRSHKDPFKHFSFVVQDNKILGYGMNKATLYVNHVPGFPKYAKVHSEISALQRSRVLRTKKPWSMVNVRYNNHGNICNSAPCDYCFNYLKLLGCKEVWFTISCCNANWRRIRL